MPKVVHSWPASVVGMEAQVHAPVKIKARSSRAIFVEDRSSRPDTVLIVAG